VLVWFVALAGLGLYAMAQENTGNIYGRAHDASNAGLPGATVTLTGDRAPASTVTDANGNFRFLNVRPGRYTITVALAGFTTLEREGVIVTIGKNTDVAAEMSLSAVQETITVTGTTPLIDTRKVQTGATFAKEELTEIPTSRDIYSLMQQVPGVSLDTVNVAGSASAAIGGPNFSSKGSGGITYLVDGATVSDNSYGSFNSGQARQNAGTNLYFDFESFDQVDVSTGGSLLDLQTPGVAVNVVTKGGTNQLKGTARYFYASDSWQASNLPQEAIDQGFQTDSTHFIREYGMDIGGPLIKDKLWIWGAGSRQDIVLNETAEDPDGNQVVSRTELQPWAFKLNGQIASSNSLSFYYQYSSRLQDHVAAGPTRTVPTQENLDIPTHFFKLEDNHVFSPDLVGSIFLSYQNPRYFDLPIGPTDVQTFYDGINDVYYGSWLSYVTRNPAYQGNATVSKFFNTGSVNHELKVGFNYRRQVNDSASSWPGGQIFGSAYSSICDGTYSCYAAITRGVRAIYKIEYYTTTIGDTLTADRLTVNAGVRWDVQKGTNLRSTAPANPVFPELLPEVTFEGDTVPPFDYNDWQPRISASYALGKDRTTLVRGSYARYVDQLGFLPWQLNGLPITSGFYYYWNDPNNDHIVQPDEIDFDYGVVSFYNVDPSLAPTPANQVTPDFDTPLTDEFTVGVDHQFFNDFAVSATYTYRHFKRFQMTLPIGADANTWFLAGTATGTAVAENGFALDFDVPFYFLTLDGLVPGDLYLNRPAATQNYNGIEFTAVKRLSNKWMLRASASWFNWKQNIPPEAVLNPNNSWAQAGPNIDGGIVVGYSGKSDWFTNSRWTFNVSALYQFPLGINLGANFFGREGNPQIYSVRSSQRDLDSARRTNMTGQVGDTRLDNVYQLDLRLEKTFNIGPVGLSLMAELFNVANSGTVLQRYSRIGDWDLEAEDPAEALDPDPSFNQIVETQSPRILRLGARITF
jgi:hypothetical protein